MTWWQLLFFWLGGWILIIVFNIINKAKNDVESAKAMVENEMVKDGNSLFKTGLVYWGGNLICNFIDFPLLHWVFMIIGVVCCIPPIISLIGVTKSALFMKGNFYLLIFSAIVCDTVPLIMALNIYFTHIV